MDLSIYIHIPFCRSKCRYCDFKSFSDSDIFFDSYKEELTKEILSFVNPEKYTVKTIFIGGGTPSLLPPSHIYEILSAVFKHFTVSPLAEITMEANPESITAEKAFSYKSLGINRISMGLQAWQNELLSYLGRIHTSEQFTAAFNYLRQANFDNINTDLMFALPPQSLDMWLETLSHVVSLSPEHISAYSLIIEEGTPFFKTEKEISEELDRKMYHSAVKYLTSKGYTHYEISNFAKKGCKCSHNLAYWNRNEYIGFGLAAHSLINNTRFSNTENITDYLNGTRTVFKEKLSLRDQYAEFMFLGLRKTEGITDSDFKSAFNVNLTDIYEKEISKAVKNNLLLFRDGNLRLTPYGIDVSNQVFCEFL